MGGGSSTARRQAEAEAAEAERAVARALASRSALSSSSTPRAAMRRPPRAPRGRVPSTPVIAISADARCFATGLDATPVGARQRDEFKYNCPLCMGYYKGIFASGCCGNYVCHTCALDYVAGKGGLPPRERLAALPATLPGCVACPNCGADGVQFAAVEFEAAVRLYADDSPSASAVKAPRCGAPSPIRVGDSFESLQRKMLSFAPIPDDATASPSSAGSAETVLSASTDSGGVASASPTPRTVRSEEGPVPTGSALRGRAAASAVGDAIALALTAVAGRGGGVNFPVAAPLPPTGSTPRATALLVDDDDLPAPRWQTDPAPPAAAAAAGPRPHVTTPGVAPRRAARDAASSPIPTRRLASNPSLLPPIAATPVRPVATPVRPFATPIAAETPRSAKRTAPRVARSPLGAVNR